MLVAGALDQGGVESVVEILAEGLPREGVEPIVVCSSGGRVADRIRSSGGEVWIADEVGLDDMLRSLRPDVVQVHALAPADFRALQAWGGSFVWVAHNLEIHRSRADWRAVAELVNRARLTLAVSESVRDHHQSHLPEMAREVFVVPNGAGTGGSLPPPDGARSVLASIIPIAPGDFLVVCLGRFDAQKNLPGLIRAFAAAAAEEPRLRLVIAGGLDDPLEYHWVNAERRAGSAAQRIHLLGPSDGPTLLAAADGFVLDSFFEGWSVAATEAVLAGLPVILSDVGGARELAALVPGGVTVVGTPLDRTTVDDRAIRVARRRRKQPNFDAVVRGLVEMAGSARPEPPPDRLVQQLSRDRMVTRHAAALRRVVESPAAVRSGQEHQ